MKTVVISLLPVALLLFCSSRCDGKGQGANSESSPPQKSVRTQPEEPANPQAIQEALQRYLSASTSPHNQEANVLRRLGDQIVPYVIEAAIAENGKNRRVYRLLGDVLGTLSEDTRKSAAPRLLKVLTDEDASIDLAHGILTMIGGLKESGLIIESELIEFRQNRPALELSTNEALIGIESTQCGSIFAGRLAKEPSVSLLRATAAHGAAARDAGPKVAELLDHSDWEIRLAAARTLGFIGYAEAVPALIPLLNDPIDVRRSWVAAESLGRLGASSAVEALRETAANHWHCAVRDTAQNALQHIASSEPYVSRWRFKNTFNFDYFSYKHWEVKSPAAGRPAFFQEPLESKLYKSTSPARMRELSYEYESEILRYDPADEQERRATGGADGVIVANRGRLVRRRERVEQVPDVALRVENGWLVGSDRGEWGGELVFVGDDGQRTYVLKENVNDLFKLGERYIAVTGLSHLFTINRGLVYEVKSVESGRWFCELWRALPSAPWSCARLNSGGIFIRTCGGGDIILSQDGTFAMATP